jgi:glycosyltransferase involved in cell wall biosynthesis
MYVEYGIGYYGTVSRYRVYESNTHREWQKGAVDCKGEDNLDAVIYNYFDLDEFKMPAIRDSRIPTDPYYLFIGRLNTDKGYNIAIDVTRDIGAKLIIAGQGNIGEVPSHVTLWGHATIKERAELMGNAIATFTPTHYREPFGGTATETQLSGGERGGTPAISTDHGAFCETVERRWRCASHREFCMAALAAQKLSLEERLAIKKRAESLFSLEAIAPQYERYFFRLMTLWKAGWYEMSDPDDYDTFEDFMEGKKTVRGVIGSSLPMITPAGLNGPGEP